MGTYMRLFERTCPRRGSLQGRRLFHNACRCVCVHKCRNHATEPEKHATWITAIEELRKITGLEADEKT